MSEIKQNNTKRRNSGKSKAFAVYCARAVQEKKAENILIIDLSKVDSAPSDFFLLCSCNSDIQVRAVADGMERAGKDAGTGLPRSEGWDALQWVVLDYFDVVVHVFHKDARDFYRLEKLWSDGDFYTLDDEGSAKKLTKTAKAAYLNELLRERRTPQAYMQEANFEDNFDDEDDQFDSEDRE